MTIELTPPPAPPPLVLTPGPLHFSTLKRMARSPAHVRHAMLCPDGESTRAMRIGTIVHHIVCGPHRTRPLLRYEGGDMRKGGVWEKFKREAPPRAEIVTMSEWADAEPIACAVLADPVARVLIEGARREVSLAWDEGGIPCATDGIDGVNDARRSIWDLKICHTSEPTEFSRHATRMSYPAQMAWYGRAASANAIATDGGVDLIAVESEAPYPVTVLGMGPEVLAAGTKAITLWLERYRVCRDSGVWPAYVQRAVPFELPAWESEGVAADED
jgi:hypothetical protein